MHTNQILYIGNHLIDIHLFQEYLFEETKFWNLNVSKNCIHAYYSIFVEKIDQNEWVPDLILMEVDESFDAYKVLLEAFKNKEPFNRIPLMILGTESVPVAIKEIYIDYADLYVEKPLEMVDFIKSIKAMSNYIKTIDFLRQFKNGSAKVS